MRIEIEPKENELEVGDVILVNELVLLFVEDNKGGYGLIDLTNNDIFSADINHPIHALNHVKKHIGHSYEIVKHNQVTLKIK